MQFVCKHQYWPELLWASYVRPHVVNACVYPASCVSTMATYQELKMGSYTTLSNHIFGDKMDINSHLRFSYYCFCVCFLIKYAFYIEKLYFGKTQFNYPGNNNRRDCSDNLGTTEGLWFTDTHCHIDS